MSRKVKGHGLMVLVGCRSVSQADRGEPCECSAVGMISLFGVGSGDLALSHTPPNRAADHGNEGTHQGSDGTI
jgi:hypothetical protein